VYRPLFAVAVTLVTGSFLAVACGTPAGGDPGGRRLQELRSDYVFVGLPDGAKKIRVTRTPARYSEPGFTGGGWRGPSIVVTFTSSASPAGVFRFYARRATVAGWRPTAKGALGLTDRWVKTYPGDRASATLLLADLSRGRYSLSGGVAPALR
jgi:hypothetical protein